MRADDADALVFERVSNLVAKPCACQTDKLDDVLDIYDDNHGATPEAILRTVKSQCRACGNIILERILVSRDFK